MSNVFNFHGNVNMTVYCKTCDIPKSECNVKITDVSLDINTGFTFTFSGVTNTKISATLTLRNNQDPEQFDCVDNTNTFFLSTELWSESLSEEEVGNIIFYFSNDCSKDACLISLFFPYLAIEIPINGKAGTYNIDNQLSNCTEAATYSILETGPGVVGVTLDENTGFITVPAQTVSEGAYIIVSKVCNGNIVSIIFVAFTNPYKYDCINDMCTQAVEGMYDTLETCQANCGVAPMMYSCNGDRCTSDLNGIYDNANCDFACNPPQLLGFIEFNDIADTPVPGNSAGDWTTHMNFYAEGTLNYFANFTSTNVIGNKVEFYGNPQLNEKFSLAGSHPMDDLLIVDYDLSGFTNLKDIHFRHVSGLTAFDPSEHSGLVRFVNSRTDITYSDFTPDSNLQFLEISNSSISSVTVINNTALKKLYLYSCLSINSLNISGLTLTHLTVILTPITVIDFNSVSTLTDIYLNQLPITSINVSNNTVLTNLTLSNCNFITSFTFVPSIQKLTITPYPFATIDISALINLTDIIINGSILNTADISQVINWNSIDFKNSALLVASVNSILAYLVSINYYKIVYLDGGTNGAPSGQGILDKATLISNGATITTN